jgi:asparagine synthase (glutamine-hydrolysing)
MLDAIRHRGPDDGGYAVDSHVCLGNRRLSILDLSPSGNQPLFSNDGQIWIVLNGEIFNYRELRKELEGTFHFRSYSDTEVLLRAYEQWGIACLNRLIGMFAFAVWDRRKGELFLCRDYVGIKPIYYNYDGQKLVFASEVKSLLAAGIEATADLNVVRDYLIAGFYDHTERTFFKGVLQVVPGHYIVVDSSGARDVCYWNPIERVHDNRMGANEAEDAYWSILQDSVQLCMRADVPYAVMLSGGLDSSVLAELAGERVGSTLLNVCTFRHNEPQYDEGVWADLVSKGRKWRSHSVILQEKDVESMLPQALWHQDEPFGGVATFADILLARMAREQGIYVLLEGQGADETLGGYEYYYAYYLADLAERDEKAARQLYSEYMLMRHSRDDHSTASFEYLIAKGRIIDAKLGQDGTHTTQIGAVAPELIRLEGVYFQAPTPFESRFENVLFRDLIHTKVPRVLRFKDKASMMHGVELRVPYLDHRLIELAFRIPPERKLVNGYTKVPLRKWMNGRLPDEITWHVKRQVQTPQREWLRGAIRPMVEELIHSESFRQRGIFDVAATQRLFRHYIEQPNIYTNSFFIWQWLQIEWWFRIFIDRTWSPPTTRVKCPVNYRRMVPSEVCGNTMGNKWQ